MDPMRQPVKYKRAYKPDANIEPGEARELGRKAKAEGRPIFANPFVGLAASNWRKGWREIPAKGK